MEAGVSQLYMMVGAIERPATLGVFDILGQRAGGRLALFEDGSMVAVHRREAMEVTPLMWLAETGLVESGLQAGRPLLEVRRACGKRFVLGGDVAELERVASWSQELGVPGW